MKRTIYEMLTHNARILDRYASMLFVHYEHITTDMTKTAYVRTHLDVATEAIYDRHVHTC